jgi:hypothetical protein
MRNAERGGEESWELIQERGRWNNYVNSCRARSENPETLQLAELS